jgi:glutamate synthase domain-containing protein 3
MSGGVAFVASAVEPELGATTFAAKRSDPSDPDVTRLREILLRYYEATGSRRAASLLADWPRGIADVWKISGAFVEERGGVPPVAPPGRHSAAV